MRYAHFSLSHVLLIALGATGIASAQQTTAVLQIPNGAQPQLTAETNGRVWLVYGQIVRPPGEQPPAPQKKKGGGHQHGGGAARPDGEIFLARSDDAGRSFRSAVKLETVPKLMLGRRRGPRIAAHGDRITVTVIAHELLAYTSLDGGKSWVGPVTINDVPTSAREGLHDLAGSLDGQLFVTWLDLRNGKMELWGASSRDAGRTWSKDELVHRSPDKSICECCHPSALFDREGNLAVMWRNSVHGARDMWLATRPKGAARFTEGRKLGEGTWKLDACPMDGGRIVAFGGGRFGAVWQRAGEVFFSGPAGGAEILVGKGTQPVAITRKGETSVFWQQGADLMVLRDPGRGTAARHAANASFATVAVSPTGSAALLAYERPGTKESGPQLIVEKL